MLRLNGGSCLSGSRHSSESTEATHVKVVVVADGSLKAADLQVARESNPIGLIDGVQIDGAFDEAG